MIKARESFFRELNEAEDIYSAMGGESRAALVQDLQALYDDIESLSFIKKVQAKAKQVGGSLSVSVSYPFLYVSLSSPSAVGSWDEKRTLTIKTGEATSDGYYSVVENGEGMRKGEDVVLVSKVEERDDIAALVAQVVARWVRSVGWTK